MAAVISWLDSSAEEQRKVRELVRMFSQPETVDDLGTRRLVIAVSDALFPGTSVLHTRARYLFFVPWFAQIAATRKHSVRALADLERKMIKVFLERDEVEPPDRLDGLIGRQAGPGCQAGAANRSSAPTATQNCPQK